MVYVSFFRKKISVSTFFSILRQSCVVGSLSDVQHEVRSVTYRAARDIVEADGAPHVSPQDAGTDGAGEDDLAGEPDGELTLAEGLVVPVVGGGATGGVSPRRDAAN